ncbi:hypothetical protein FO519_007382 [Halicephalobus sp. NKZ332]|nr:hypothetical protein FO519_007382 [Halicephalobus sp. NKZ332]
MYEARRKEVGSRRRSAIEATRRILGRATPEQLARNRNENLKKLSLYRSFQDHSRIIAHFDLDYFFVQAQLLQNPEFRNRPIGAGSDLMIVNSTSNYEARKFGVKAGVSGIIAKQMCPDLVILPLDFKLYSRLSKEFHNIMRTEGDSFSCGGIDEAYIDLTKKLQKFVDPKYIRCHAVNGPCLCRLPRLEDLMSENDSYEEISTKVCEICNKEETEYLVELNFPPTLEELIRFIRMRVLVELNLTCSGGCAPTYPVAKVCSDFRKPNGQTIVLPEDFEDFNFSLKLNKFGGIGPVMSERLSAFEVETIKDAFEKNEQLSIILSPCQLDSLLSLISGLNGPPCIDGPLKNPSGKPCINDSDKYTIGHESTFTPSADPDYVFKRLEEVVEHAIYQASKEAKITSAISIKIKYEDHSIQTRIQGVPSLPFTDKDNIFTICSEMLEKCLGPSMRLLGVRFTVNNNETKIQERKVQNTIIPPTTKGTLGKKSSLAETNKVKKETNDRMSEDEVIRELMDAQGLSPVPKRKKINNS